MRPLPGFVHQALAANGRDTTVVVVRLGAMGDILRTLAPVRLIRQALPLARIHWVADRVWSPLLEAQPDLTGTVALPRREWRESSRGPGGWRRLASNIFAFRRRLRDLGADIVVDFHGNLRSGVTARMTGATVRLGYAGHQQKEGNRLFTTHRVASEQRRTPRMERNLALVSALGIEVGALPGVELPLARSGEASAGRIRDDWPEPLTPFAVLAPGASARQAYKRPPAPLLAAAGARLAERGVLPLVVWGPGEEEEAQRVVDGGGQSFRLAPPTDLATLAALLAQARIFVGGDTGPLHMACAAGCPVVGLYGPTDPVVNQPWGVPFRALHPAGRDYTGIKKLDRRSGFDGLEASTVAAAVDSLLGETKQPVGP